MSDVNRTLTSLLLSHTICIRMNLALPLSRVQEAFDRLDKYVFNGAWV